MFGEYMFLFAPQQVGISYKVKKHTRYLLSDVPMVRNYLILIQSPIHMPLL